MQPTTTDISMNVLANVVTALGPLWERRLTEGDRQLVRDCCLDAARLGVRALAAPRVRDVQLQLLQEKARIHARLSEVAAPTAGRLHDAFWDGFRATVNGAVAVAFAAI